jgi:hypothetical protein
MASSRRSGLMTNAAAEHIHHWFDERQFLEQFTV